MFIRQCVKVTSIFFCFDSANTHLHLADYFSSVFNPQCDKWSFPVVVQFWWTQLTFWRAYTQTHSPHTRTECRLQNTEYEYERASFNNNGKTRVLPVVNGTKWRKTEQHRISSSLLQNKHRMITLAMERRFVFPNFVWFRTSAIFTIEKKQK